MKFPWIDKKQRLQITNIFEHLVWDKKNYILLNTKLFKKSKKNKVNGENNE